jgi:hypothetical protein
MADSSVSAGDIEGEVERIVDELALGGALGVRQLSARVAAHTWGPDRLRRALLVAQRRGLVVSDGLGRFVAAGRAGARSQDRRP